MATGHAGWKGFLGRFSWALYDRANSAFATLIVRFIFPIYFQAAVGGDPVKGRRSGPTSLPEVEF
jgi:MFS-type transporter involved in bile tolerance (Atg22 family)